MQLLYRSIDSLTIGGVTFILRVTTDGVNTVVDFEQNPKSVTAESRYDVEVSYGNLQRTVSIGSHNSGAVTFPYAADAYLKRSGGVLTGSLTAAKDSTGKMTVRNIVYGTALPDTLGEGDLFILLA